MKNKEVSYALYMLLHCAMEDDKYTTQKEQFDIISSYIKELEDRLEARTICGYPIEEAIRILDATTIERAYDIREDVIKASHELIDLIEVGDYVNGLRINSITEADKNNDVRLVWHINTWGDDDISFSNEEIKSILTKEQFESVKYEVKKDE